jgi:hypothetical protein
MSSPSGPQQPFTDNQQQFPPPAGQPGQFPPPGGDPNQGGFPPPQGGGFQPAAPQPPRRGGGWGKRIVGIVAVLVVLGGLYGANLWLNRDAARNAKVGDCVAQESAQKVKIVECGSSGKTEYKVVGRVEDKTEAEAKGTVCEPFADKGVNQLYWEGEKGKKGLVLCLGPVG